MKKKNTFCFFILFFYNLFFLLVLSLYSFSCSTSIIFLSIVGMSPYLISSFSFLNYTKCKVENIINIWALKKEKRKILLYEAMWGKRMMIAILEDPLTTYDGLTNSFNHNFFLLIDWIVISISIFICWI